MLSRDDILAAYAAGPEAVVQLVETLLASQAELRQQGITLTARVVEWTGQRFRRPTLHAPVRWLGSYK
jgi:hypothetical protein